jgi:hypothetical protein
MDLLRLLVMLAPVVIIGTLMWVGVRVWPYPRTASLRREVEAQVCFATALGRASVLRMSGITGTGSRWYPVRGPIQLTVGTSAFLVFAPQAVRQFAFRGSECSIAISQAPSRSFRSDWIVITGLSGGRPLQLAIAPGNLPEVWQALAAAGAAQLAGDASPSQLARLARPRRYSLRRLAAAVTILLVADAAVWLGAIAFPWLGKPGGFGAFAALLMFVTWFYRARVNADGYGWPQRRPPGLAIWAWFFPVVNLYIPFQIMADIWRAGLPAEERSSPATLPAIWWMCVLAFYLLTATTGGAASHVLYVAALIKITGVLAEVMTAVLVQKVARGPLGQEAEPSGLVRAGI